MYKDLADALDKLKSDGYIYNFELSDDKISCKELDKEYKPSQIYITQTYMTDQGTDPGSESTLYALESNDGNKGYLIISYGIYSDPKKAKLIDNLKNKE